MNGSCTTDTPTAAPYSFRARLLPIAREPLIHFLVLGLLLLLVDQLFNAYTVDSSKVLVVDDGVRDMLVRKFVEGRGRGPTPEEYEKLVALWTKNEVMYREALSLGLDKGDEMIRSRIILKMRNLVYGNIVIREPDPGELQAWLEAHRERYELPRRFDLEQVELGAGDDAAAVLSATRDADAVPAAYADQLRRYRGRSRAAVAATFGDDFAEALARAARGEWVLLDSEDGRHLARVTAVHEAVPATLESRRGRIEADWRDAQAQLSVMDQLAEIRSRYVLRRKDSPAGAKADAQEALTESRG